MKSKCLLAAACFAALPVAASAQTLRPGLWEITHSVDDGGELAQAMADMRRELANMPAEERKQMERAMAAQGMQLGSGTGGLSARVCMTQEMVERSELPGRQQGQCRTTRHQRIGNTVKTAYTCTQPPSSGEGEFTLLGPEAYRSRMTATSLTNGKTETVTMQGSGKWISASCGAVKPMSPGRP